MDHGELATVAQMRVGVEVVCCAVCGPAGVPDTNLPVRHRVSSKIITQHRELAGAFTHLQFTRIVNQRNAG